MKSLVYAGGVGSSAVKATAEICGALKGLGHEVAVAVFLAPGEDASALEVCGADQVLCANDACFEMYDPGVFGVQLAAVVSERQPDAVFFSHSYAGRELASRLAQRLGVPLAADITSIEVLEPGRFVFKRMVYGGKAYEIVEQQGAPVLASVRPGALRASGAVAGDVAAGEACMEGCPVAAAPDDALLKLIEFQSTETGRPALEEADVVVSIGRGCNEHARQLAAELADLLGAALGSSRGMVDSGIAGYELQVGQTGKSVAPHLYIACGISGSIQHQAGMSRSDLIVAINTDENAPIFEIADYGIVADAEQTLASLIARLKS